MHTQIKFQKERRLAELQITIDSAQAEINTIRRELGLENPATSKTPAEQFQTERDAKPNPFAER